MNISIYKKPVTGLLIAILFTSSCMNSVKKNKNKLADISTELAEITQKNIVQSKYILHALPSPLEIAIALKRLKLRYNEELLNPLNNVETYVSSKEIATNLGVYIADLSFTSLFSNHQNTARYMSACKILADKINITDAISPKTLQELENNINDRELISNIIADIYMASNSYLMENEQMQLSTYIIAGSWIESLYLTTQVFNISNIKQEEFSSLIISQKLSLDILLEQIELLYQEKDNNINMIVARLEQLKKTFDKFEYNVSTTTLEYSVQKDATIIKSDSKIIIDEKDFRFLKKQVKTIRNEFVS